MDLKKTCLLLTSLSAFALPLPAPIMQQLPLKDASILTAATSDFDHNGLKDYVVVLRYKDEEGNAMHRARNLFVYMQIQKGTFALLAQNARVVLTLDDGGVGGDPFDYENGKGIAVNGTYFTVENAVAGGMHWTDYITFNYVPSVKNFVFHSRIFENWEANPSEDPHAEALVKTTHKETKADPKKPILLPAYTPF